MRHTSSGGIITPKQQLQSLEILKEAARLLRQVHFSAHRGAYAAGTHVSVSVDPRWNDDHETLCVLVTCYAFGHRQVHWEGQPIWVQAENPTHGGWVQFLDRHGQTILPCLPQGTYRLSLRGMRMMPEPVLTPREEEVDWAAADEATPGTRRVWYGESRTDGLLGTVEETEDGEVWVAFETQEARLAGQRIGFFLVEPESGLVRYSQETVLDPARTSGKWEATCCLGMTTKLGGPYHLVCEVVPRSVEDVAATPQ